MIKTCIVDFDGTLADTLELTMSSFNDVSSQFGYLPVNNEQITVLKNLGAKAFIESIKINPVKLNEIVSLVLKNEEDNFSKVKMFPGLNNVINELHRAGIKLGILTNNTVVNVEVFLKTNSINFFSFIHSIEYLSSKEDILNKLILQNMLNSTEVTYIGDESRDIDAARGVGIKSIAVTWGFNNKDLLNKSYPDFMVESPDELLKIVRTS